MLTELLMWLIGLSIAYDAFRAHGVPKGAATWAAFFWPITVGVGLLIGVVTFIDGFITVLRKR